MDKAIQAILHNSNIGITMNISMKRVVESQVDAMDLLGAELEKDSAFNLGSAGYTIALQ